MSNEKIAKIETRIVKLGKIKRICKKVFFYSLPVFAVGIWVWIYGINQMMADSGDGVYLFGSVLLVLGVGGVTGGSRGWIACKCGIWGSKGSLKKLQAGA